MKKAGLYIHIPFCTQKCSYCDFFSVKHGQFLHFLSGKNGSAFVRRLIEDVHLQAEKYAIDEWESVYIGGGTPSLLSEWDIDFLFSRILKGQKKPPKEFTIEVNPDNVCESWLKTAVSLGLNRVSVGIQSFSDTVLRAEKRRGSGKQTVFALERIKKFDNLLLSCDLIAGLKGQSKAILKDDIDTVLRFAPQHLSLYSLCTAKKLNEEDSDRIDTLWLHGKDILEKNGYVLYEVSNFSYKDLYKSVHNSKYWQLTDYGGVGPGAVGSMFFDKCSKKPAGALRFSAGKRIEKWLTSSLRDSVYEYENVSEKELMEETFMMNLRLAEGLDRSAFIKRFGIDIEAVIKKTMERWEKRGYAHICNDRFALTSCAFIFLNSFLQDAFEEIDRYYRKGC